MLSLRSKAFVSASALITLAGAAPALGYLGSFTPNDGYSISVFTGTANWADVTYYNAGAFGVNAGGGSGPTNMIPDTGLWKLTSSQGAFFPNPAMRAANTPPNVAYPSSVPAGTVAAYIVGNHFPGRGGDGSNLAVRNDTPLGSGAIEYEYSLDSYDFGGISPSTVTSGTVKTQFYFCPNPGDSPNPGTPQQEKFTMSFVDSGGAIGLQWGYARDNEVYWRQGSSGAWNYTGIYANAFDWDGVRLNLDLTSDTFMLEYYTVSNNTWQTLATSGTALGAAMSDYTRIGWKLEDGLFSGVGGKNYFDDFSFMVPAPGSGAILACAGLLAARRRRRA